MALRTKTIDGQQVTIERQKPKDKNDRSCQVLINGDVVGTFNTAKEALEEVNALNRAFAG